MITLIKSRMARIGGLEKYTWQIAKAFCLRDIPVSVLTTGEVAAPFESPLLSITALPVLQKPSVVNVLHFDAACAAHLKKFPTPIVFGLDRNRFQTHLRAGNGAHAAYLQRRINDEGGMKRWEFALNPLHRSILHLEKRSFEHPLLKTLFTNSNMVKQEILRHYSVDPDKICVLHNGVEWEELQKPFDSWQEKRMPTPTFQFLFIGHNYRRKGLDKLLKALALIKNEDFQLSVIGKEKDLNSFRQMADRLGLSSKVLFLGPQQDIISFYQMADALVIPSLYDPFANVTVEALSMGLHVISSKNNGGHEVLQPEMGSVVEDLDDTSAFAALLKKTLSSPKTQRQADAIRMGVRHLDFSMQLKKLTDSTLS